MRKFAILVLALAALSCSKKNPIAPEKTFAVHGNIILGGHLTPVNGVLVRLLTLDNEEKQIAMDITEDGLYSMQNIHEGNYKVVPSHENYRFFPMEFPITINSFDKEVPQILAARIRKVYYTFRRNETDGDPATMQNISVLMSGTDSEGVMAYYRQSFNLWPGEEKKTKIYDMISPDIPEVTVTKMVGTDFPGPTIEINLDGEPWVTYTMTSTETEKRVSGGVIPYWQENE